MSDQKHIKVTTKNGRSTIVPASQRATYEAMNIRYTKLKKLDEVVTIEDYVEPKGAKEVKIDSGKTAGGEKPKGAKEVIDAINAAENVEAVDALIEGDTRATVLAAANQKKEELSQS